MQVKAGDVLVVQNRGVQRAAVQFWPAGSQQAQACTDALPTAPPLDGVQGGGPRLPLAAAADAVLAQGQKRKHHGGDEGSGMPAAVAASGDAHPALKAAAAVRPAGPAGIAPRASKRSNWQIEAMPDGATCHTLLLSEAVVLRPSPPTVPHESASPALKYKAASPASHNGS